MLPRRFHAERWASALIVVQAMLPWWRIIPLTRSPTAMREVRPSDFYRIPMVKQKLRMVLYMVYVLNFSCASSQPDPSPRPQTSTPGPDSCLLTPASWLFDPAS